MRVIYWLAIFIVLLFIEIATMGRSGSQEEHCSHSVQDLSVLGWECRSEYLL